MTTALATSGLRQVEVSLERFRRELAEINTIEDSFRLLDSAVVFEVFAAKVAGDPGLRLARECRADVERRVGQILASLPKAPGRRTDLVTLGNKVKADALEERGISRKRASELERIASIPEDQYEAAKEQSRQPDGPELSHNALLRLAAGGKLAAFSSESVEWYTPAKYVEAAREALGYIDLDPASSAKANEIVQAKKFLDRGGLEAHWTGNVWLNPPYGGEDGTGPWVQKMLTEYEVGHMRSGVLLVNAVTDRVWFQPLWDFPICFTDHRIQFYTPSGHPRQPISGNAFVYFGKKPKVFAQAFAEIGAVVVRFGVH